MAGIDNLAAVMGRDADMDHVERDRLCDEAAAEITRLREALAAEREECARVADDYKSWHEGAHLTGEYFAAEKIAAAIRARGR